MTARWFLIMILFTLALTDSGAQETRTDNLLREEVIRYGQAMVKVSVAARNNIIELSENISVSNVRNNIVEAFLSPLTIDWFISQRYNYDILERTDSKSVITAENVDKAMEWESYPSYTQYDSIMRIFALQYPSLCILDTVGTSNYGKLVMAVKISDNAVEDEDEPEVFYTSTMHGNETAGFVLMLRLADYLLENYDSDARIRNMVDNLEIWINPLSNPDGTYLTGNTITETDPVRYNAYGYDLNRNFPDPGVTNVVRQKETIDMMKFMTERRFVLSANFHSGSEVVNYPWDRWPQLHADNDWFYDISRKYVDTVHLYSPAGYMNDPQIGVNGVTNGYDWYSIRGGRQDYVIYELQGREVTIELVNSYVTPSDQLDPLWQYNWRSLLGYLENAMYGIHGTVKDAITGVPVAARIFISGHDKDNSHIYSDILTGSFTRLLAPGIWDIMLTASGYYETEVTSIVVGGGQATEIIVEMTPVVSPVDTIPTPSLIIYPNPSDEYIKVILPQRQKGNINIKLYSPWGFKLRDYPEDSSAGYPLHLDISGLSPGIYTLIITNTDTGFSDTDRFVILRK
jgi:hypothetical protein